MTFSHIQAESEGLFQREYITIGEIIIKNKNYVVIAATSDNDNGNSAYADVSMIPRSVIISIKDLIPQV